jgi:hypothetical protein
MYKKPGFIVLLGGVLFLACQTEPNDVPAQAEPPVIQAVAEVPSAPVEAAADEGAFDPQQVSQELFDATLDEVQRFITALNTIIRARRYDDWIKNLSREYIETYSSPDYLKKASADPLFKSRRIVLASLKDFFMYNVVPSRANIDKVEVDDIEFITPTRVKAYTVNARGQRLRLYELEKDGGDWKVVN